MMQTIELWTIKQSAAALKLSTRTVQNLVSRGELRALKIGRSIRFDPRDVAAYIDARRAASAGEAHA